jgi:hypothetical protein
MDLISKGVGATSEYVSCGPRIAGLISVLSIIIIVDYHSIMAILLKRFNLYSGAVMTCKIEYESAAPGNIFDQGKFFGEIAIFMTFEAFIFFAQILSMPLWVLRARFSYLMGVDAFIASKSFSEETYDVVLHKMYFKMMNDHTNPESYDPSK